MLAKSITSFASFQTWGKGNGSDSGIVEVFIARSMGRLGMKPNSTLLGACLVAKKTELLFEACINDNTFGHSDRDSIVLM